MFKLEIKKYNINLILSEMSKLSITPINPNYNIQPLGYCPYMEINAPNGGSYKTLTEGLVAPERQASSKDVAIPEPLPNGGLYNAPQATGISVSTNATGGSATNANLPPYLGINFIIKT